MFPAFAGRRPVLRRPIPVPPAGGMRPVCGVQAAYGKWSLPPWQQRSKNSSSLWYAGAFRHPDRGVNVRLYNRLCCLPAQPLKRKLLTSYSPEQPLRHIRDASISLSANSRFPVSSASVPLYGCMVSPACPAMTSSAFRTAARRPNPYCRYLPGGRAAPAHRRRKTRVRKHT